MKKFLLKIKDRFKHCINSVNSLSFLQKFIYYTCYFLLLLAFALLFKFIGFYSFLVIGLLSLIVFIYVYLSNKKFKETFNSNLFIFGVKGAGKDLLMQSGVYLNRKNYKYVSNMDYGYSCEKIDNFKSVFDLSPNTYRNLLEDTTVTIPKNPYLEGKTLLLSDASIYMPSHEDTYLSKNYPSFPLFYAISRHLYNMPIVVNTQVNGRLWKKLREQVQDGYIQALKTSGFGWFWSSIPVLRNYAKVSYRYYQKEASAIAGLLPFRKVAVINNVSDKTVYMTSAGATKEMYNASHGVIYDGGVLVKKTCLHYDTRHFHNIFFGYPSSERSVKK